MHPDRVVIGADPGDEEAGDAVAALYEPLGGEIVAHRRRQRRDDQARLQRLPRDQDLLHQRDRQRLRGGRRRRRRGRPRDGPRRADRPLLPARRDRLRGQLLPQGRQRAEDARRQHRLPLPAAQRGDRGQRAAEAPRGRQAAEAPRLAARAPRRAARPRLQAGHRRHARGARAWCSRRGCRARGPRSSPTTRSPGSGPPSCSARSRCADSALDGARRAPTPRSWSPSGPSSPSSTGRGGRERWRGRCSSTAATSSTPTPLRAAGFEYEGIGRAVEASPARPSRTEPMQAIVLVGGEGTRLRPLTATVPKPALTLVDRPFLAYMVEWLAGHGVEEVVLACGFLPDVLREALGEGERSGPASATSPSPSRWARPARSASPPTSSATSSSERFLALNGDVLTDLDLTPCSPPTRSAAARATLGLHPVEDSAAYGLVSRDADGAVLEFLEKTGEPAPGEVNAGMYVLERSVLDLIPPGEDDLDRARGLPAAGRRGAPRHPARGLLDGHRHPRALPAGDLGHPRGRGRDRGRADRARACTSTRAPRSPRAPSSARARCSGPAAGSRPGRRCANRSCSRAAWPRRAPRSAGSILAAGASGRRRRGARRRRGRQRRAGCRLRWKRRRLMKRQRCSTTSSRCPTTFATPSGGSSRPGSRPPTRPGSLVCGMGGSAIGGDLAAAALGERLARPLVNRARLPAARLGRRRLDGALLELLGRDRGDARLLRGGGRGSARGASSPAPAAPSSTGPARRACRSSACRGSCSRGPRSPTCSSSRPRSPHWPGRRRGSRPRSRTPPPCSSGGPADLEARAAEIAERLAGTLPVIYGGELTRRVARRWKTQVNENAKLPGLLLRAARGRPQRDLRLGRAARGRAALGRACSRTPTSTRACAAASS